MPIMMPGNKAAQEQVADRGVGDERVHHHRDGRRDDWTDRRGCRSDRSGIAGRIPVILAHHLDDDLAEADRVGDGGAGHAREDHVGDHVDVAKSAAEAPDEREAEFQQPFRDRPRVHDVGGGDEQRDGEQQEAVEETLDHLLGGEPEILPLEHEIDDRGHDHGERNRRAHAGHPKQGDKAPEEGGAHRLSSRSSVSMESPRISLNARNP